MKNVVNTKMSRQKQTLSEAERREKIALGLRKKKECEAKALRIVERLIEETIEPEWFRDAVSCHFKTSSSSVTIHHCAIFNFQGRFLNPSYYDDLIDERNCEGMCGYALCTNPLGEVRKQKYHISIKEKKVYDLTERKVK